MGLIARLLLNERAKFDRICGELQTARSFPEDVEEIRDIPYLPDTEPAHRMDVYRPKRTDGPLPVVLDVHGGGLAMGSKAYNRWFNAQLRPAEGFWYIARTIAWYRSTGSLTPMQIFLRPWTRQSGWPRTLAASPAAFSWWATAPAPTSSPTSQPCSGVQLWRSPPAAGVQAPEAEIRALGLISGMFYTTRRDKVGLTMPRYLYGPGWREGCVCTLSGSGEVGVSAAIFRRLSW